MEKKYFFVSQIRKSLFLMTVLYVYYNTFSMEYLPSAKLSLGNCSREEMWNECDSSDGDNCWIRHRVTETPGEGDEALLQRILSPEPWPWWISPEPRVSSLDNRWQWGVECSKQSALACSNQVKNWTLNSISCSWFKSCPEVVIH